MPRKLENKNPFMQDAILATASWIELEATIKIVEVHTLRGDNEDAEMARRQAHDLLDSYLDTKQALAVFARRNL
jgi:hypothetical protein